MFRLPAPFVANLYIAWLPLLPPWNGFLRAITADGDCSHEIKTLAPWKKSYDKPRQHIKKQRLLCRQRSIYLKLWFSQWSCTEVRIGLDHKESWVPKNWCFWTVVLEKTLESPLDCKEIHLVNPKGNQSLIFIGRTDTEAEAPIVWPPDAKSWFIEKDPNAGKYRRQEEKRITEDEMVRWHHWLNGHEFEQVLGDGEGQRNLVCCSPWDHKKLDMTEWLTHTPWGKLGLLF